MTDPQLEQRYWRIAEAICTDAELVALRLRNDRGLSPRKIALALGVDRRTIRDRLDRADQKILVTIQKENAA